MEKIVDFDEWLSNYKPKEPEYVAVFDPETSKVVSVGPSAAFEKEKNKISIPREIAESIIEGSTKIESCVVDVFSNSLEIAEIKSINKIDDVLHRVIDKKWSKIERPDVYLTYNSKNKTLKVELSEELGGTKKLPKKFQPIQSKKIIWDGNTEMNFLITEYNDPNLIYEMFSVKIEELVSKSKTFQNVNYENFSVYTRRFFKNYVIEIK